MSNFAKSIFEQTATATEQLNEGRWGPLSHLIGKVHQGELWRPEFANFSEWMTYLSEAFDISRARCWRYKKAGSYYNTLRANNDSMCELYDLPEYVSAEALEILERLERVAPKNVTENIKDQVLKGQISIRTLKQTWAAYRPALEGATSRGRGRAEFPAKVRDSIQFEAESILALTQDRAWTGKASPARCVVLPNVEDKEQRLVYDGLALVQLSLDSPVEIHVFELHSRVGLGPIEHLKSPQPYADYCWLVLPEADAKSLRTPKKNTYGVIGLDDGKINIHSEASKVKHHDADTEPFMRELLKLALRN